MRSRGVKVGWAITAMAVLLSGCGITRSDAPVTLKGDHRLKMVSPGDEDKVQIPVTVKWSVTDFPAANGNHFGLFVDRAPLGARKDLRWRICSEQEKQPIQPGEDRRPCKDDRKTVFLTDKTEYTFNCFEPKINSPKRTRYQHEVSVILLNGNDERVGEAATTVKFDVTEAQEKKCRGFDVGNSSNVQS